MHKNGGYAPAIFVNLFPQNSIVVLGRKMYNTT